MADTAKYPGRTRPPTERLYAAIMAGGSGTRFWPLSRRDRPKQLIRLFGGRSLLSATAERLRPLCPPERWLVVTAERLAAAVAAELPDLPAGHAICEPVPRNTAPCMVLAAAAARARDPEAIIALLPADHFVSDPDAFRAALAIAADHADRGHIVTLGVKPGRPETGYGYIERGRIVEDAGNDAVYDVVRFVEKPDQDTAVDYLAGGRHLWNAGVFVVRADVAIREAARHLGLGISPLLAALADVPFPSAAFHDAVDASFAAATSISIDHGIAEKARNLRVVPLDAGWSDVGAWQSLLEHKDRRADHFERGDVLALESPGSVLVTDGPFLAALGLPGVAIIVSGDAVLALPVERAQEVRRVVTHLEQAGRDELL